MKPALTEDTKFTPQHIQANLRAMARNGMRAKSVAPCNRSFYPLIAHILGLKVTEPIDGKLSAVQKALKR